MHRNESCGDGKKEVFIDKKVKTKINKYRNG